MFGKIVSIVLPVILAKWLAKDEEAKVEREKRDVKQRRGVNPLLAVGALVLGTAIGGVLGFLYSPKSPNRPGNG